MSDDPPDRTVRRSLAGHRPVEPSAFGGTPAQRPVPMKKKKGSHCQQKPKPRRRK